MASLSEFRKLREDLKISRQETPEGVLYIVKDPETARFYKFEETDFAVIECFRSARSPEEVIRRFKASHPGVTPNLEFVQEYQAALNEMGLLERTRAEKNLMVMEKIRDTRRKKALRGQESNIFFITFPAVDPNRFFDRIHPYLRFFWRPWFVVLSMIGIAVMAGIFVVRWDQILRATLDFYNFRQKTVYDILEFLVLMFVIVGIHECGHGLTCKNFGGEVHEIGFVLFYFTPAFYCDVNDAYLFEKKWHKLWVTFAGAYIELVICTVATFVWLGSHPDSTLYDLSYKVVLFTGLSSVFFNINPLVKLDGYYALMDFLEIPNLRERAFEYLGHLAQSRILRMKGDRPVTTRRQRRVFLTYGLLSLGYTATILWVVLSLARNGLDVLFPGWGWPLALGIVYWIVRKRVRPFVEVLRKLWRERKEAWMTRRTLMLLSGGTAAALALLVIPRLPVTVQSSVTLEPERVIYLSALADGIVRDVRAAEGDLIRKGDLVAVLRNEDLVVQLREAEGLKALAESEARYHRAEGRVAEWLQAGRRTQEFNGRVDELRDQLSSLRLLAPEDGILVTPRVEDLAGTLRRAGETFLELGTITRMRAVVRVSEWDVRWIAPGQQVRVRLEAFPFRTFQGQVEAVAPAASLPSAGAEYRVFEARLLLENPGNSMRPGMAGIAKIYARPRSVADRVTHFLSERTQSLLW